MPGRALHYFNSVDDLVCELKIERATGRLNKQLNALLRPSILVVDEVGYLPPEHEETNKFFQPISRRHEPRSTIITSNKSYHEWGAVFGDDIFATAILDGLLHHCEVLASNDPSYRPRNRMNLIPDADMAS